MCPCFRIRSLSDLQFAGFELPSISSSTVIAARRKENLLNWMKSCFSSFGSSQNDVAATSRTVKRLLELIKGARTVSEKEEIVDSTYRFTLTLLFALSLSIAVLSNAYNHFKDLLEQGCDKTECDKKNEALQMIHYQFTKIYKIKEICQSMEHLFRNLGSRSQNGAQRRSKKRRLSRSSPASQTMVRYLLEFVARNCEDFMQLTNYNPFFSRKFK